MIGIRSVRYAIPERRLCNAERVAHLGIPLASLERKIGIHRVSRKHSNQETSDLCEEAGNRLFEDGNIARNSIDCLAVVTQNPDGYGLPHTSAVVHRRLRLDHHCVTFDISLGCSGYVAALAIVRDLMHGQGMNHALLFTADPYSKIIDDDDRDTALLFGDAATVTYITTAAPVWRIGDFDFGTRSESIEALRVTPRRSLYMNGQAVLSFAVSHVPPSIHRALSRNGCALNQVDRIILHQGSRYVVEAIGSRLSGGPIPRFYAADYGNTVSSAIPIAFVDAVEPEDRIVVLSGFGVGLCWATTVLERFS